jgi:hypothetical protein
MTVLLGSQASNAPLINGRSQAIFGSGDVTTRFNNTVAGGTAIKVTPGGADMSVSVTVAHNAWWHLTANLLWSSPDAVWTRADWYIGVSPADALGVTQSYGLCRMHSAMGWVQSTATGLYRLSAGTYTAKLFWGASPYGFNQDVYHGSVWTRLVGQTFSESNS